MPDNWTGSNTSRCLNFHTLSSGGNKCTTLWARRKYVPCLSFRMVYLYVNKSMHCNIFHGQFQIYFIMKYACHTRNPHLFCDVFINGYPSLPIHVYPTRNPSPWFTNIYLIYTDIIVPLCMAFKPLVQEPKGKK